MTEQHEPVQNTNERKGFSLRLKFLLLALAHVVVILLCEVGGRIYLVVGGLPWNAKISTYRNDDLMGYRPNPYFSLGSIRLNSKGFRADREYSLFPPAGVTRILAAGGSTTFGPGVELSDTWPALLENSLTAGAFEVVNSGVSGWQILQIRHSMDGWLDEVNPHLVLISSTWNTAHEPYKYYRNENLITYPIFEYSILFRLLDRRLRNVGLSLHYHSFAATRAELTLKREALNQDASVFDRYEEHVRSIVTLTKRRDIPSVFIIPPGNLPDVEGTDAVEYFAGTSFEGKAPQYERLAVAVNRTRDLAAERLLRIKREQGISLVDARSMFDGLDREQRQQMFRDELHMTVAGNARMADFLARELLISGMVNP